MWSWTKNLSESEPTSPTSALKNEADVVPQTELSSSRQALNNISIGLNTVSGEPSGVKSTSLEDSGTIAEAGICSNKFCCGEIFNDDDYSKNFIDHLRLINKSADSIVCHRPTNVNNPQTRSGDLIEFYDPYADYNKLECPESPFNSIVITTDISGRYVQLKEKKLRFYCEDYDIFATTDKITNTSIDDKSPHQPDYQLLSDIEYQLDDSKFSLDRCKDYNERFRSAQRMHNCESQWKLQDFNDDQVSTRMCEDTAAIAEYYKISNDGHIVLHFLNIEIDTGNSSHRGDRNLIQRLKWCFLKGREITEDHKVKNKKSSPLLQIMKKLVSSIKRSIKSK